MALVWLLLLVGSELAGHSPQAAAAAGGPSASRAVTQARGLPAATPFGVAALSIGRARVKDPFRRAKGGPEVDAEVSPGDTPPEAGPESTPRPVCPMRVIKVDASFDRGFVVRLPSGPPDPIVRDDLSGCGK